MIRVWSWQTFFQVFGVIAFTFSAMFVAWIVVILVLVAVGVLFK